MCLNTFHPIWSQCFCNHYRSKVASTNSDVYNIFNFLSRISFPFTAMDFFTKGFHFLTGFADFGHNIFTINCDWLIRKTPQCGMHNCTVFSFIDFFSGKHCFPRCFHFTIVCQQQKLFESFLSDDIFRIIKKNVA